MALGRKTGGCVAGTPNRQTRDVQELLASLGCDPIQGMAEIASNPEASLELRGRLNAELAKYVYPKGRAAEHTGAGGEPVRSEHRIVFVRPAGSREAEL